MNKLTKLRRRAQSLFFPPQKQRDAGAGIVEYAAIIILVAAIAVAIFQLGLVEDISGSIGSSVDSILDGPGSIGDLDEPGGEEE